MLLIVATIAARPICGATTSPTSAPASQSLADFKIEHWGEQILIPVQINGESAFFILDTGSTYNTVSLEKFPKLVPTGTERKIDTGGGMAISQMFQPPDLYVGPVSLINSGPVNRDDLSTWSAAMGFPIAGILGVSAIKEYIIQIDFDGRRIRFLRPDNLPHSEWGNAMAMQLDSQHVPAVRLKAGDGEENFEIDTGSSDCVDLPSKAFDRLRGLAKQPTLSSPVATLNGILELRDMRLPLVDLGGFQYHDLIYSETKAPFAAIGLPFLERNLVTLDFPGNRLYLKPGREINHRVEENMSGIHCLRLDQRLVAKKVDVPSPAYQAGIRENDVILQLNGKAASDYDMSEVRELLSADDGNEVTITVLRGEAQQTGQFRLRRRI